MIFHTVRWYRKINWPKIFLVGIIYTVIATIVHQVEAIFTLNYYMMSEYFGVWSKVMMPNAGPPPAEFFITSTILTLATGISLGLVYCYIREMLPKNFKERVFLFADLLIGLNFIFFILPVYLLFNVPAGLLVYWFVSSFIILLSASYINIRILK